MLPRFAIQQFMGDYRKVAANAIALEQYRVDAIVLARIDETKGATPDPQRWELCFENASFRAWKHKEDSRSLPRR